MPSGDTVYDSADPTHQDMCGRRESTSTREKAIAGFTSGTTLLLLLLTSYKDMIFLILWNTIFLNPFLPPAAA